MTNLEEKIKTEIKKVKPTEKWEIVGLSTLKDAGLILLWLIIVFLIGMIFNIFINFRLWENIFVNRHLFAPGLMMLPYELFIILVLLFLATYFLVKKVHLTYRLPKTIIISILIVSSAAGFILAQYSGFNHFMFQRPGIRQFYQQEGKLINRHQPIFVGSIIEQNKDKITLEDQNGQLYYIVLSHETRIIGEANYEVGDLVRVVGYDQDKEIQALTICKLEQDFWGCRGGKSPQVKGIRTPKPPMY